MSFLDSVPIVGSYRKSNRAEEMVADAKRRHRRSNRKLIEANTQSHKLVEQLFDLKTFSSSIFTNRNYYFSKKSLLFTILLKTDRFFFTQHHLEFLFK